MISDNIKYFRKAKGLSQEELAIKINVVRQTVSKWENGLSVPDADVLIQLSEVLEVSVNQLLGLEMQREHLLSQANKKRGVILTLSFLSMLIMLLMHNEILSLILVGICMLLSSLILYRNLTLLTNLTANDFQIKVTRLTTVFDLSILILSIIFALLTALDVITLSENVEKVFAMSLISCVMIFAGMISPKLPFSKHTGLRLPWTVLDEDTWHVAHRVLGILSIPVALLYVACTFSLSNFEAVTFGAIILWLGIPALISFIFYYKKLRGIH